MSLQLHVWGPGLGLASVDAECLASIAFFSRFVDAGEYVLIQSSPSAVPTHQLPALYDVNTQSWHSGFPSITHHLQAILILPEVQQQPTRKTRSDAVAYASYLAQHALPLITLSLYVSSANYTTTVRPAYSAILPFPLGWTEPPALRAAMVRRAEHLGMSSLDADADAEREENAQRAEAAAGWVQVPRGLLARKRGVGELLAPEQKARIRLEGLAREVLDVLAAVDWDGQDGAMQCLAWAYLALMLVPRVPRAWLRETMMRDYEGLCAFVERSMERWFVDEVQALPWSDKKAQDGVVRVGGRFANGLLGDVPGLGQAWRRWLARRRGRGALKMDGEGSGELLRIAGAGVVLVTSALLWRKIPQFGAPVQIWQREIPSFLGIGAAGLMLSGLAGSDAWI
ncbi:Tom37 C-terminal domain-containing protein [Echria macrotheca]|uniref:Tom37 C-terminal domain-containing protein n=1 Tax=Echria macrotheca TaxID=438768 RepID=A0AAJ0F2N4_9PEZI|nr:Tom37 C-terminal domain-containing protein [Echria macrotheca]